MLEIFNFLRKIQKLKDQNFGHDSPYIYNFGLTSFKKSLIVPFGGFFIDPSIDTRIKM